MSMSVLLLMSVQMLMYQSAMEMHVLVNQIRSQEQLEITENLFCGSI
jgi:hypothetical protein